ncbi:hypothetical protein HDU76_006612 [Blyttiomyces sp. JEL0837]|nr:hypothetical protein HDU76_006612 [Blyttiomyces sp. JEL0837]
MTSTTASNQGLLILSPVNTVPLTSLIDLYQIRQLATVNIRIKYIPRVTPYLVVYTCLSLGMLSGIVILVMLFGFDYVPCGGGVCCGGARKRAVKDSRKGRRYTRLGEYNMDGEEDDVDESNENTSLLDG